MRVSITENKKFLKMFNRIYNKNIKCINGISIDSREIRPNDIFIPISGEKHDGHHYIEEVLMKKNTICFDEKTNLLDERIIKTESNKSEIINIAKNWRKEINSEIIAITGSNGKTTMKDLIHHILNKSYKCSKSNGNYNSTIGLPLTFLNCKTDDKYTIVEMGANKDGEIKQLCRAIKPNLSLITNISNAHIKNFKSIEQIAENKSQIFLNLENEGTAFININDQLIKKISLKSNKVTFGLNNNKADYNGKILNENELVINDLKIKIPKQIFFLNESILGAYAICNFIGLEDSIFQEAINTFIIPKGRGEIISKNQYKIINDTYNASPASMKFGIKRFSNMSCKNNKIIILGDMLELGEHSKKEHEDLSVFLNPEKIDIVFTYGPKMLNLHKKLSNDFKYSRYFSSISDLKKEFKNIVKKNDLVFLKGSRKMKLEEVYN